MGLSPAKLRQPHWSIPANPLLAEPMYLAGYIERMGTGTGDIIRLCNEAGLKEPEFIQEEDFKTIIWRTFKTTVEVTGEVSGEPTGQAEGIDNEEVNKVTTGQVTGQVSEEVKRVILLIVNELRSAEIQNILQLKHREYFRDNYLLPALESGLIEMTFPDSPNHPNQR